MKELLRTENIKKSFGENEILGGIDICLNEGEVVSIVGGSGIGKTTLFNIISGLTLPDEGRVLLGENDITGESGHISYMLQKDLLLPNKRVIDNVALPLILSGIKKNEARQMAEGHFSEFGLSGYEKAFPDELSGGMRQRAALLRTYLSQKNVMLLDEPFSALDMITRESMHEWFLGIVKSLGLSILFITHDVDEALLISDRIYVVGERPAKITGEFKIGKENKLENDFSLSNSFTAYKRKIKALIKEGNSKVHN